MAKYRYYQIIDGGRRTCSICSAEAIVETDREGERYCRDCARTQMDFSTVDPNGLFKLLDVACFYTAQNDSDERAPGVSAQLATVQAVREALEDADAARDESGFVPVVAPSFEWLAA